MRYTRKNISELLDTVKAGPDVTGFSTSNFGGYSYTLVSSFGGGVVWQSNGYPYNTTCEDGGRVTPEDAGSFNCY